MIKLKQVNLKHEQIQMLANDNGCVFNRFIENKGLSAFRVRVHYKPCPVTQ